MAARAICKYSNLSWGGSLHGYCTLTGLYTVLRCWTLYCSTVPRTWTALLALCAAHTCCLFLWPGRKETAGVSEDGQGTVVVTPVTTLGYYSWLLLVLLLVLFTIVLVARADGDGGCERGRAAGIH